MFRRSLRFFSQLYKVSRVDTHGNKFNVRGGLEKNEAEKLASEFEAKQHKQGYFVEKDDVATNQTKHATPPKKLP